MIIIFSENLNMILGLIGIGGLALSISLVGIAIFLLSSIYLRRPVIPELLGNLSSLVTAICVIGFSIKRAMKQ